MRTDFTAGEPLALTSHVAQWLDTREIHAEDGVVLLPDRELLLTSMYSRSGVDLVISTPGGVKYVVKGFFLNEMLPTLSDGAGTEIPGELAKQFAGSIAPEQYAQAAGGAPGPVIGVVRSMNGEVRVIRASDGSEVVLKIGDALYQDDIVETSAGGTVGLVFIDGTTLALGENGELVLDELVYDPSKAVGRGTLRLVSGAAEFVSGGIAKSGADAMTFQTPVATIGIRGTRVFASYDPVTGDITILNRPTGTDAAGVQTAGVITLTLPNGTVIGDATLTNQGWQWNPVLGTQPTPVTLTEQQVQNIAGAVLDTVNNLQTQISQQPNLIPTPAGGGTNAGTGGTGPGDGGGADAGTGTPPAGGTAPADGTVPPADGTGTPPATTPPQTTQTPSINTGNVAGTLGTTGNTNPGATGTTGNTGTGTGNAGAGTNTGTNNGTNNGTGTNTNTNPTANPTNTGQQTTPTTPLVEPVLFSIEGGSAEDAAPGAITFTVTRSGNIGVAATVNYATASGTAGAGTDFTANAGTVTFAAGETSKTVTITVLVNPGVVEPVETFTVSLNGASAAAGTPTRIASGSATGTIIADPPLPTLTISGTSVTDATTGTALLTVTRSAPLDAPSTVSFRTVAGTAVAGTDFNATTGTVTFAAGQATAQVSVGIVADSATVGGEAAETFQVELFDAVGAIVAAGGGTATVTIDADPPSTFSIGNVSVVDAVAGTAVLTVTRTGDLARVAAVGFQTVGGTATPGSDFTASTGVATFAAGQATTTISIPIIGDLPNVLEQQESFQVELINPIGGTLGQAIGTVTIAADPVATFSVAGTTVVEGNSAVITVTRGGDLTRAVSVGYTTQNGSASSGSDYVAATGTISFAAGQTAATITISTVADNTQEGAESFGVVLRDPLGGTISQGTATVNISADPPLPTLSISSGGSVSDAANGSAVFTVTLSAARTLPVTVSYSTVGSSADSGSDFGATSGTLTFAPGQTSATISVPVYANATDESEETFGVVLSAPSGATIASGSAFVNITADPVILPSLTITDVTVSDAVAGNAIFQVNLSSASTGTVTVQYTTVAGTANSSDFTPTSGTLTFEPGIVQHTITVPILANASGESAETFSVVLSNAVGATIADSSGVGTISADTISTGSAPSVIGFYGDNSYIQFDGYDDTIVSQSSIVDMDSHPVTSHTTELWVRTSVATGTHMLTRLSDADSSAWMGITAGKLRVKIEVDGDIKALETTATVADNAWHHVAYTFNATTGAIVVYIDGQLASTTLAGDSTIGINAAFTDPFAVEAPLELGGTGVQAFLGSMDEVRVWQTPRTIVQMAGHYNQPLDGSEADLLLYYNFSDVEAGVVSNTSPFYSSNDGSASGSMGSQVAPKDINPAFSSPLKISSSTQYVESNVLSLDHSFSLTAVVRVDGTAAGNRTVFSKAYGASDFEFNVFVNNSNHLVFQIRHDGGGTPSEIISGISLDPNLWYGVGVTFDDTSDAFKIYIDGVQVASGTVGGNRLTGLEAVRLGGLKNASLPLQGDITAVTIWEKALDLSGVEDANSFEMDIDAPGLLAAFPFTDGMGSIVNNAIGAFDAQIYGTVQWQSDGAPIPTVPLSSLTTYEDTPLLFRLAAIDADGHTLAYSAPVSATGAGGTITHISGNVFRYTPPTNAGGGDTFTVRVTDSSGQHTDETLSVNIGSANDRPVLQGTSTLPDVVKGDVNPAGTVITTIFGSNFVDSDGYFDRLVVVGNSANPTTQGAWQYSTNSGTNWYDIGTVANDSSALVLESSAQLRFVPVATFDGSPPGLAVRPLDSYYWGSSTSGATRKTLADDGNANKNAILGPTTTIQANVIIEFTWDGGGSDGLWQTGANWSLDRTPLSDDRVVLNATATLNNASSFMMTRLTLGASADLWIASSGATITTSTGGSLASGGSFFVQGTFVTNGLFTNSGAWDIDGSAGVVTGTGNIVSNAGVITLSNQGRINLTGSATLTNQSDVIFRDMGTTSFGGKFINAASGLVTVTSNVFSNADIDFTHADGIENSGAFEVNAGSGGSRTLRFDKFLNKGGGSLNIYTNTTIYGGEFEGESGSKIMITSGATLTLAAGEFKLDGTKFGGPPVYPLGGVHGGVLLVKGGVTLNTEHSLDIGRSGGYLTVNLGEQGGANAIWESYGDSGFAYEVDVEGVLNIYSAEMNVTPVVKDLGVVNVIDATGVGAGVIDSVTWNRGFMNWNNGTINLVASNSASTLTVYSYVDDGTGDDSPSTDSSELFADNYGLFELQPGSGHSVELILDGIELRNRDTGVISVTSATGLANITLRNGAQINNMGAIKLDAANTTNYARLTIDGDLMIAGTLLLVGAGYTAASAGNSFTPLMWTGDAVTRFEEFEGLITIGGAVALDPTFSSGGLNLVARNVDFQGTGGVDVYTILNSGGGVAYGGSDADVLTGAAGDDLIFGGDDADVLVGLAGNDRIFGEGGNDDISGGDDNDDIYGGEGDDDIDGGDGNDYISGGLGEDELFGAGGDDVLSGGDDGDYLNGGGGHDILYGGAGTDNLFGESGEDTLYGGAGNDSLSGGNDDDILIGGYGEDTLLGGAGADQFVYLSWENRDGQYEGYDTINDFATGVDKIVLNLDAFGFQHSTVTAGVNFFAQNGSYSGYLSSGQSSEWDAGRPTLIYDTSGNGALYFDPDGNQNNVSYQTIVANFNGTTIAASDIILT